MYPLRILKHPHAIFAYKNDFKKKQKKNPLIERIYYLHGIKGVLIFFFLPV
jgi:hypothetical protein